MSFPLVSVITPTYNHEKYIKKCIESVLDQTYKNWEMIIINDKSSDKTQEIIEKFFSKEKRIKVINHKTRWGIGQLRKTYNQGLKVSKGKYIAILEGDDFWPSNKLYDQIISMSKTNKIFSFGDCVLTDSNGKGIKIREYSKFNLSYLLNNPTGNAINAFLNLSFIIEPSTVVIKKDTLISIGGFKNNKHYKFVDIPTWPELALKGKFDYINKILGYYRKHSSSSWFKFAKKTTGLGEVERHSFLIDFIKKKKSTLIKLGINIDLDELEKKHKEYIELKRKNKQRNLLFYTFIFNDRRKAYEIGKRIISSNSEGIINKIIVPFVIGGFIFRNMLISIIFSLQYIVYISKFFPLGKRNFNR